MFYSSPGCSKILQINKENFGITKKQNINAYGALGQNDALGQNGTLGQNDQINNTANCLGKYTSFSTGLISIKIGNNSQYLQFKYGPLGINNKSNIPNTTIPTKNCHVKKSENSEIYYMASPSIRCLPLKSPKLGLCRRNKSEVNTSKMTAQKSEASNKTSMVSTVISKSSISNNLKASPSSQNTKATHSENKSKRLSTKLSRDSRNFEDSVYMRRTVTNNKSISKNIKNSKISSDIHIRQLVGDQEPAPSFSSNLKINKMIEQKTRNIQSCISFRTNKSFSNTSSKSNIKRIREMKTFKKLSNQLPKNEIPVRVHEVPMPIVSGCGVVETDQSLFKAKRVPKSHNAPHVIFFSTKKLTEPKEPKFSYGKNRNEIKEDEHVEVINEGPKVIAFNYLNQDSKAPDVSNFYDENKN